MEIKRTDEHGVEHIITLTSQELESAYRERELMNLIQDARRHINVYCESEEIGYIPHGTRTKIEELCVARFEDQHDCNEAENDIWFSIVASVVDEALEEIEEERAKNMEAFFATNTSSTQKWYVAFFAGETENEYIQSSSPFAAITTFQFAAEENGNELLEVHECMAFECLPPVQMVYPYTTAAYLTEIACGTVATCKCNVCLTSGEVLNIDSDSLTDRDFVVFEGSNTKHLVLPADETPDANENILFWRR
jgi:hypothetical protein